MQRRRRGDRRIMAESGDDLEVGHTGMIPGFDKPKDQDKQVHHALAGLPIGAYEYITR